MERKMQPRQLKTLIETGHYRPEPALIAQAMLSRRSVYELLTEEQAQPLRPADRTPPPPESRRRAA